MNILFIDVCKIGSWDYFGLNHYTSGYSQDNPKPVPDAGWSSDQHVNVLESRNGMKERKRGGEREEERRRRGGGRKQG